MIDTQEDIVVALTRTLARHQQVALQISTSIKDRALRETLKNYRDEIQSLKHVLEWLSPPPEEP